MQRLIPTPALTAFAQRAYANHDNAHGFEHAMAVYENAVSIAVTEGLTLDDTAASLLPYVMIGHDFRDHKLASRGLCLPEDEILAFYTTAIGADAAAAVMHMHDNCSWSKRETAESAGDLDWMRRLLQDADWLEAIGDIGIQRCVEYTRAYQPNENLEQRVCEHIREKLLLIADSLHYAASRKIAEGRVAPMMKYLAAHEV